MSSNTLRDLDRATLHPYTNLRRHEEIGPLIATRGEGVRIFDDSGRGYIDAMAGLWCASLGFAEPRLGEAAKRQMGELGFYHQFSHKAHDKGIELAAKLIEQAPRGTKMSRVLFANSGSEANDTAIKLIWYFNNALGRPAKKKIVARRQAYHGVTIASASLTALPVNSRDFDLPLDRFLHLECPYAGRSPVDTLAAEFEALIEREGADTIAAFFAEPVMGAGGVIVPPEGYFPRMQEICRRHDILMVADEVICGFYRTGERWGSETLDFQPDMLTSAKALSASFLPISAVMISDAVYQVVADNSAKIGSFGHGYTYSGHPVAAAVALETLAIYEERDIKGQVAKVAPVMQKHLRSFEDHPLVGEVRGIGLIGALELVEDKAARRNFDPKRGIAAQVVAAMQKRGVIGRAMLNDSLAFSPPLIVNESELDEVFGVVRESLDEVFAVLTP